MQKRISFALVALYLFPWGIQVLVDNFISVYTGSLPFATEKTVGEVGAIGAIVTMIAQLLWTRAADRIKDKSNALTLSLLLVAVFASLFLVFDVTKPLLFLFVTLFYSCYLTHQPLIDTIASDNYSKTNRPFGWFRSFASFGYAAMGFLFTFLPNDGNKFFIYVVILALVGAAVSRLVKSPNTYTAEEKKNSGGYMNRKFVCFLIFSFLLFMCSRTLATFFGAYYCDAEKGLGGSIGVFSLLVSIGTFGEWAVMLIFGRLIERMKFVYVFLTIALAGIFRCLVIFLVGDPYLMSVVCIFSAVWYGFLWSSATPYIKKIVPEEAFASAQGIWSVIAFGIAPFVGNYLSGVFAETFGYRILFLAVAGVMALLALLTPVLIKE